tara:strand:- start:1005 stop:1655 length:651 start_codon:yes stop_codon:yes gene_type:complete
MKQFIIYLVVAPILVIVAALYILFSEPKKNVSHWWNPDRETYVMFSIVQQHHKGSIEIRARGKNFFKPGVPFKGEWLLWNNSFFERTFRVHFFIYDERYSQWVRYTMKDKAEIITLAPMEDKLITTIGYVDPEVMSFEREMYKEHRGWKKVTKFIPMSRSVTINIVISNADQPQPVLPKKFKTAKTATQHEGGSVEVDPGLRVGEDDDDGTFDSGY